MSQTRTQQIKELRQRTQMGYGLIKEALDTSNGDLSQALHYLAQHVRTIKGGEHAGLVVAETHQGRIGALVEVRCETDFVARTQEFRHMGRELALQVVADMGEGPLEGQPYFRDPSQTVGTVLANCSRKVGEQITLRRYIRYEL